VSNRGSVSRVVGRLGSTYTLKSQVIGAAPNQWTQGAIVSAYQSVRAFQRYYKPRDIVGSIKDNDVLLTMAFGGATPVKGQQIAIGEWNATTGANAKWMMIVNAYPLYNGGIIAGWKLQARA
jgi:hypothetical protein